MTYRKLRIGAIIFVALVGAAYAYYLIGRQVYLTAANSAFPGLPLDGCYYIPWPVGPKLIGQLEADDPAYLRRSLTGEDSQGMHLTIYDSDGMFAIESETSVHTNQSKPK
jgi:hypothetical protein